MTALTPFFQGLQISLMAVSVMLLGGALYGMVMRTGDMSPELGTSWPRVGGTGSAEKRRRSRTPCNLFVELLHGGRVTGTGRLVNLSATGACFVSNTVLQSGDYILARLPGLRNGVNKISGHVVWHKTTEAKSVYGVRLYPETPA
jgi:hypothetical protein